MNRLKIPHNAFVLVGDGRKALFLRNEGDEKFPNLKAESVFETENPATHEQGSDRPGCAGPTARYDFFGGTTCRCSSASCAGVTRAGAPISRSSAFCVIGNAITSRMFGS